MAMPVPSFIPVPFREEDVPLAMTLSEQLRHGKSGLKESVLRLLELPVNLDSSDEIQFAPYQKEAKRILRSSEAGRKAVLLAMANGHGQEVSRKALLEAYSKAEGLTDRTAYHLVGVLSGVTRRSKKEGFPYQAFESRWDKGRNDYFYKMHKLLAEALIAASKS